MLRINIEDAQRDVRTVFLGGFAGQLVSSVIWFASAALATWYSPKIAIITLLAGGFFIFPLTQLLLKIMGRPNALPKGHPMNSLGMQVAFSLPLNIPVAIAATLYRMDWFYPALMIILGTHYLPFIFMYGMRQFALLAALLIGGGFIIGLYLPTTFTTFSTGGWYAAVVLLVFAFVLRHAVLRSEISSG